MSAITFQLIQNPCLAYGAVEISLEGMNCELHAADGIAALLGARRPPLMHVVKNAKVLGMSNVILNADHIGALNNIVFNPLNQNKIKDDGESNFENSENGIVFNYDTGREIDRGVFIGTNLNFGHWLFNHLARMCYVGAAGKGCKFIISASAPAMHVECLGLFGIPPEDVLRVEKGELIGVAELLIPQMPWHGLDDGSSWWTPNIFPRMRRDLGVNDGHGRITPAAKVFLSRKNTRWRRVQNEDELFSSVRDLGFVRVDPGELTIHEQLELGRRTEFLITPFGANSSFFLFMPDGACVLELAPPIDCMNVTPLFAKASNLVFRQQVGSVMPNSTQRPMDQDYVIGKDEFLRAFEEIHSR